MLRLSLRRGIGPQASMARLFVHIGVVNIFFFLHICVFRISILSRPRNNTHIYNWISSKEGGKKKKNPEPSGSSLVISCVPVAGTEIIPNDVMSWCAHPHPAPTHWRIGGEKASERRIMFAIPTQAVHMSLCKELRKKKQPYASKCNLPYREVIAQYYLRGSRFGWNLAPQMKERNRAK